MIDRSRIIINKMLSIIFINKMLLAYKSYNAV